MALAASSLAAELAADLCTGGDASGTGLRGAYYSADPASVDPVAVRVDGKVAADQANLRPEALQGRTLRAVKWCGWIRPVISGTYAFPAPAGVRIELGRRTVTGPGGSTTAELVAGQSYAIVVDMPVDAATTDFRLRWTPPFGATYAVPTSVLFPPVDTVKPGC